MLSSVCLQEIAISSRSAKKSDPGRKRRQISGRMENALCIRSVAVYVVCLAGLPACLFAQWSTGSNGSIYYNGGNVGINTSNPFDVPIGNTSGYTTLQIDGDVNLLNWGDGYTIGTGPGVAGMYMPFNSLDLRFQTATVDRMAITSNGNVGIGNMSPRSALDVNGTIVATNRLTLAQDAGTTSQTWHIDNSSGLFRLFWQPNINTGGTVVLVATTAGNVGIGTANPQYPLSVNGTIQAKEVIVNTNWSDYVFDPGYKLMPLPEVASYIQQHHHLPGVPPEAQVKQKGISVGRMESTLLAKVEELTLHMIQMQHEDAELREQNHTLQRRVARLEEQVHSRSGRR